MNHYLFGSVAKIIFEDGIKEVKTNFLNIVVAMPEVCVKYLVFFDEIDDLFKISEFVSPAVPIDGAGITG